jgi:hypothetical protein
MKQFTLKILGVAFALSILGGIVFSLFLPQYYLPVLPFLLLFFVVVTLLIHVWQLNLAKKDMAKFTRNNMLITFVKLVLYSVVAVSYIAFDSENAVVFVVCVMLIYLIFTFIEVVEMAGISRNSKS